MIYTTNIMLKDKIKNIYKFKKFATNKKKLDNPGQFQN